MALGEQSGQSLPLGILFNLKNCEILNLENKLCKLGFWGHPKENGNDEEWRVIWKESAVTLLPGGTDWRLCRQRNCYNSTPLLTPEENLKFFKKISIRAECFQKGPRAQYQPHPQQPPLLQHKPRPTHPPSLSSSVYQFYWCPRVIDRPVPEFFVQLLETQIGWCQSKHIKGRPWSGLPPYLNPLWPYFF